MAAGSSSAPYSTGDVVSHLQDKVFIEYHTQDGPSYKQLLTHIPAVNTTYSSDIRYYSHDNLLKNNSEKYYLRVRILHSRSGETTVFEGSNKLCRGKIRRAVAEKI